MVSVDVHILASPGVPIDNLFCFKRSCLNYSSRPRPLLVETFYTGFNRRCKIYASAYLSSSLYLRNMLLRVMHCKRNYFARPDIKPGEEILNQRERKHDLISHNKVKITLPFLPKTLNLFTPFYLQASRMPRLGSLDTQRQVLASSEGEMTENMPKQHTNTKQKHALI